MPKRALPAGVCVAMLLPMSCVQTLRKPSLTTVVATLDSPEAEVTETCAETGGSPPAAAADRRGAGRRIRVADAGGGRLDGVHDEGVFAAGTRRLCSGGGRGGGRTACQRAAQRAPVCQRRGGVDYRMGAVMIGGGVIGSGIGALLFRFFQSVGQIDVVISILYVLMLGSIGTIMLREALDSKTAQHRQLALLQQQAPRVAKSARMGSRSEPVARSSQSPQVPPSSLCCALCATPVAWLPGLGVQACSACGSQLFRTEPPVL